MPDIIIITKEVIMKKCNKCKEVKPLSLFHKDRLNKADGHYSICKNCKTKATLSWRDNNRDRYNKKHREYCKNNYYKLRLQRYKITPEEHTRMLMEQKGVCAICKQLPKGKRPLAVDHDHKTLKVRGLLCFGCNRAIAILDNKEKLDEAILYLKR